MSNVFRTKWIIAGLAGLATIQIIALVAGSAPRGALRPAELLDLDEGRAAVVLVFHSTCAYCDTIAEEWRDWIGRHVDRVRIVAVAGETPARAEAYAARKGWSVEIVTFPSAEPGTPEHQLTMRTPWVYVLDAAGTVVADGHGGRLEEWARSLDALLLTEEEKP